MIANPRSHIVTYILAVVPSLAFATSLITENPADPEGASVAIDGDLLVGSEAAPKDLHVNGGVYVRETALFERGLRIGELSGNYVYPAWDTNYGELIHFSGAPDYARVP